MPLYKDNKTGRLYKVLGVHEKDFRKEHPNATLYVEKAQKVPQQRISPNQGNGSLIGTIPGILGTSYEEAKSKPKSTAKGANTPLTKGQKAAGLMKVAQMRGQVTAGNQAWKDTAQQIVSGFGLYAGPKYSVEINPATNQIESTYTDRGGKKHTSYMGAAMSDAAVTNSKSAASKLSKAKAELAELEAKANELDNKEKEKTIKSLRSYSLADAYAAGRGPAVETDVFLNKLHGSMSDEYKAYSAAIDLKKEEIALYFPEMLRVSENCRFAPCTHTHEPGCAVKEAVEAGEISYDRYSSYLGMLDEEGKYR